MDFLGGRKDLRGVDVAKEWRLILTSEEIKLAIQELAKIINHKFENKNVVVVCILKGASYFFVDLTRELIIPHSTYFIEASSYRDSQTQSEVEVCSRIVPSKFENKEVILIDELYDNGSTLEMIRNKIIKVGNVPQEKIFTCTLFKKNKKTNHPEPNLYGLIVPDVWLVGYGLDDCQEKRNWTYLYACPKSVNALASEDDLLFESEDYYQEVRKQLTSDKMKV